MTFATDNRWPVGSSGATVPDDARAAYAARWIDLGDSTDVLGDRQGFAYNEVADRSDLIDVLIAQEAWTRNPSSLDYDAVEVTINKDWSIARRRAGGYVYVEAWLT